MDKDRRWSIDKLCKCLPEEIVKEIYLKKRGIKEIWKGQQKAIQAGLFKEKSIIVSLPSGAGKTFIGEWIAIYNALKGNKTVYLCPLKALSEEKYEQFKEDYFPKWFGTAIFTRDRSSTKDEISNSILFIGTYEKIELLLRNEPTFFDDVKAVVIDEIQVLDESNRGPLLETLVTRLKRNHPRIQFIALSATLNDESLSDLAKWLTAEEILDITRPVELVEGYYSFQEDKLFLGGDEERLTIHEKFNQDLGIVLRIFRNDALKEIIAKELTKKFTAEDKTVLVFGGTRRQTENFAKNLGDVFNEIDGLQELCQDISDKAPVLDKTRETLSNLVRRGIAFHHAGLSTECRRLIENAFREGFLRVVVSTTTLAAGINSPADIVILLDHRRRFLPNKAKISKIEYKNMVGRAGRFGFSDKGSSILLSLNNAEENEVKDFIDCEPDRIFSKLGITPVFRALILSLIATEKSVTTREDLISFMKETFYPIHYGDFNKIVENVNDVIDQFLIPQGLVIERENKLEATELGSSFAKTGMDPFSTSYLVPILKLVNNEKRIDDINLIFAIAITYDFIREAYLYLQQNEINTFIEKYSSQLVKFSLPEYDDNRRCIKGFLILKDWISEVNVGEILSKYNIEYGDLERIVPLASWIAEGLSMISEALKLDKKISQKFLEMTVRINQGIKKELLSLYGNGRIIYLHRKQARNLFNSGYKEPLSILSETSIDISSKAPIRRNTVTRLKQEYIRKLPLDEYEKVKYRHLVRSEEMGYNIDTVKNLYDAKENAFTHNTRDALKNIFEDKEVNYIEKEDADNDICVEDNKGVFATIECYAPSKKQQAEISKILEARESIDLEPKHMVFCTNVKLPKDDKYLMKIKENEITLLHVSGLVELLLRKRENTLTLPQMENIFGVKGVIIDKEFVQKLIRKLGQ